jgi:hypothetical protein
MKTKFLLPERFKTIGWILLIPSAIAGLYMLFFNFDLELKFLDANVFSIYSNTFFRLEKQNLTNEIIGIVFLIGSILVAFSREKQEDEFISKIRLESLVWATYINYAILFLCFLFFFEVGFLYVMIFNMFTILIIFIIRFNYILYRSRKSLQYEK